MSYFDLESENFRHYVDAIDQKYNANTHVSQKEWFNDTQEKIVKLLRELLKQDNAVDLHSSIHLDPLLTGDKKIKDYILVQCVPKDYSKIPPQGEDQYHIGCYIGVCVNIRNKNDITFGIGVDDSSKRRGSKERSRLKQYKDWAIAQPINGLDQLPTDSDAIIVEIKPVLEKYIKDFKEKFMSKSTSTDLPNQTEAGEQSIINKIPRISPLNQILFGPPGTGKTYNTINKALAIIENKKETELDGDRTELKKRFDSYLEDGQIMFTTFHQNMSYEDFIEGIKPIPPKDNEEMTYKVKKGIFRKICKKAKKATETDDNCVAKEVSLDGTLHSEGTPIVVDDFDAAYEKFIEHLKERKSISLKGRSKKEPFDLKIEENSDSLKVIPESTKKEIPISKNEIQIGFNLTKRDTYNIPIAEYIREHFVQNNNLKVNEKQDEKQTVKNYVLIIDEINRGNVSKIFGELITLIEDDKRLGEDEALQITLPYSKKQFGVPNNLYIIGTMNTADRSVEALDTALRRRFSFVEMPPNYALTALNTEICGHSLKNILENINKRIEKLLGKDNLIGHSYFLSAETEDGLKMAFQNKIIPLLQEYFFGDYGKIGLVLGKGFFDNNDFVDDEIFAEFDYKARKQLAKKEIYSLKNVIAMDTDTFKKALDNMKIT